MTFRGLFRRAASAVAERASWLEAWAQGLPVPSTTTSSSWMYGPASRSMQASGMAACVRLIAGNTAKLPLPVYRRRGETGRERDRNHPLDRILNRQANPWTSAFDFRRTMTAHAALGGNAYALKQMVGSQIDGLIAWDPAKVKVIQDDFDVPPYYELTGKNGGRREYQATDILHLRDLSLNGTEGDSRSAISRQGIALSIAAETYATSYFANGAEGGTGLIFERNLNDSQRKEVIEAWKASHQGAGNAFKPFVLDGAGGGVKIDRMSSTNKDAQMIELRSFQVEDQARAYGVPPHMVGLTEKQTSYGNGVEQQSIGFLQFHLLDWLLMWESAIHRDLLVPVVDDDVFVEHMVDGLLRGDFKTRMEGYGTAIQWGVLTRNEARAKENLPAVPGGDEILTPMNMGVGAKPPVAEDNEPATLPGDRPRHAWRTKVRSTMRVLNGRES